MVTTVRPMEGQVSDQDLFRSAMTPTEPPAPPPEPTPAPLEPPAGEPPPAPVSEPPAPAQTPPAAEATIPPWRLREEADRARAAEDRARMLEDRLRQVIDHVQQNTKQPDFFDDPSQATRAEVLKYLQPLAEEQRKGMMAMGKMVAEARHGEDKVSAAEQAFLEARDAGTLDVMDYERVVQAGNRYDAVVQWHRRQHVLSAVGDDPDAWFQRKLEERMNDPQFQASVLERARGSAATRPASTQLPPSLSHSTASAPAAPTARPGDLSDASLWNFAMTPKNGGGAGR